MRTRSITQFIENDWRTRPHRRLLLRPAGGQPHRHPNNKQVLLNTDGSVRSVQRIPRYAQASSGTWDKTPYAPYVAVLRAQNAADTGSTSPALPITLAAGFATAVATTTVFALRRRRTRAATR